MRHRLPADLLYITTAQACDQVSPSPPHLTLYVGRSEEIVKTIITQFENKYDVPVTVRYGGSAQLAATILEEGSDSPADVYYGQEILALGTLARNKRLKVLPLPVREKVDSRFRSSEHRWVGISGRARVLIYNTNTVSEVELPDTLDGLTDSRWNGLVGWAPTNSSFQSFVTAMRLLQGEKKTKDWLSKMVQNGSKSYRDNTPLFEAILSGEIHIGLTNHYYLFRQLRDSNGTLPAQNYSPRGGGPGALVNVAGAGIVDSAPNPKRAQQFIEYLLSAEAQAHFSEEIFEYPLVKGVSAHPLLQPLSELNTPRSNLNEYGNIEGTLQLLEEAGAL